MAGLFNLPDDAVYEVDDRYNATRLAQVVVRQDPGGGYGGDAVAEARCIDGGDQPSDLDWARKIAELLNLEHVAVRDGYKSLAERLRIAEAAEPVAMLAMQYVFAPDDAGLERLRLQLLTYRREAL